MKTANWFGRRIGFLLALALFVQFLPAGVIPVAVADDTESQFDWLGSDAPIHPPLGDVPDDADPDRGEGSTLQPGSRRGGEPALSLEAYADYHAIFPPDERIRISPTTHFPARTITLVEYYVGDQLYSMCSGTFIGPNVVLTAAHCLYNAQFGWATSIAVIPGKDGENEPFGFQWAAEAWVPAEWVASQPGEWDWGLLRLPDSQLGTTVGWLQIGMLSTGSLAAPNFNPALAGYPGDKPLGTMWFGTKPAFLEVTPHFLLHHIDTFAGQSGASVWRGADGVIVGIHIGASEVANYASRIDGELLDDLLAGCAFMNCQFSYIVETPGAPPPPGNRPIFTSLSPGPFSRVVPGDVTFSASATSDSPIAQMTLVIGSNTFTSNGGTVSGVVSLGPGVYVVAAQAVDTGGDVFRAMWDIVVSNDPNETAWFTGNGQPKQAQINATMRSLVEAFRWHLYGQSWDGSIPDLPTHASSYSTAPAPPSAWVIDGQFHNARTTATLRSLVEVFRWHFWGISWDGQPHPEAPTHASTVQGPQNISPWFDQNGNPDRQRIEATLRSLVEAFRWHFWGFSWDGQHHFDSVPTHGY